LQLVALMYGGGGATARAHGKERGAERVHDFTVRIIVVGGLVPTPRVAAPPRVPVPTDVAAPIPVPMLASSPCTD
jgi:hypothetical protein